MDDNQPTTRQVVLFTVVLSFIVSIIGTVLALGVLAPFFGIGEKSDNPISFGRPWIFEKIVEPPEKEIQEKILRADELVVQVVEATSPAVVSIVATKDVPVLERFFVDPFGEGDSGFLVPQFRERTQRREVSSGSGFLVSDSGHIVTNKHVVSDAEAEYTALFNDGKKMSAKVLARDPVQDIAILKVEGKKLPFLKFGDSDGVKIGQGVIAIGNALGEFRNTVSVGVISGLQRSITASSPTAGAELLQELIQTDAAINPGNSGGPLLNIRGEVIAINTAIASGAENIGFAIPANKAKRDLVNVEQHGRIIYPFLGVRYVIITKDLAEKEKLARDYGALLSKGEQDAAVVAGSPAEKAGLKEGDIVLEIQGVRIDQDHALASLIQKQQVGQEITLKVFRDGKESDVKVKLEERK